MPHRQGPKVSIASESAKGFLLNGSVAKAAFILKSQSLLNQRRASYASYLVLECCEILESQSLLNQRRASYCTSCGASGTGTI